MRQFTGRGALITGGASGIGIALARALAARARADLAAFGPSAEPGFAEGEGVLRMMAATAYPPEA